MTENDIELKVEKMIDHLDRIYMAGDISNEDYEKAIRELCLWANAKYAEVHHD